jgi:integrase/recombinase XerD
MTPLRQRMLEDMQLRGLTPETQRSYVHYMAGLARFYQTSPDQLGLEEIREYQLYLINERRLSPDSVNAFVSAAKFFYHVTLETPWPDDALPRCRVPYKLPVVLSPAEIDELFHHVCTIRYRAALMTAYGAGLRVSEVVSLRVGDIDSQRMLIRVRQGKGKKDRYAMLPPVLLAMLRAWWRASHLAKHTHRASPDDWLFPGWRKGRHMCVVSLQDACREAARAAGLSKRVTVHSLRHAFATHLLENGSDIRIIQALLGHARIDTTARYAAVSPNCIARTPSPLDRLAPAGPQKTSRRKTKPKA